MARIKGTVVAAVVSVLLISMFTPAGKTYGADLLEPVSLSFEAGKIRQEFGADDLYFVSLQPTFTVGALTAVIGLNVIADHEGDVRDDGNDLLVIDSMKYRNDKLEIYYGEIENLTLGSGFVVSNYRNNIRGNVPLNRQRGIELDIAGPKSYLKYFGTRSKLQGFRAVRNFGMVNMGTTAVTDSDPDFEEIAVDAEANFLREKITLYAEHARIKHYGDGSALGVIVSPHRYVDAKVEFRDFDADFVPGLVDEHYEVRPALSRAVDTTGRLWGLYTCLDLFIKEGVSGRFTYEDYQDSKTRITLTGSAKLTNRIRGELSYAQENNVPHSCGCMTDDTIARARLFIRFSRHAELILDYYNAYDDTPGGAESLTVKTRFKLR